MKKFILLTISLSMLMLSTSCVKKSKYQKLQAKYDSLLVRQQETSQNFQDVLNIINEVEASFSEIKEAERIIDMKKYSGELTPDQKKQIRSDMHMITNTLKESRKKIQDLEKKLKSNVAAAKLFGDRVKAMNEELNRKEVEFQQLLEKRNVTIMKQDSAIIAVKQDVDKLSQENAAKAAIIDQQEAKLNTVFYCFGTARELKEHKILQGGSLFSSEVVLPDGFNKDYFLKADRRELRTIPLFVSKAKVKTKHPSSSYEFEEGEDGNLSLHIISPKDFWSISKYLVIEVR